LATRGGGRQPEHGQQQAHRRQPRRSTDVWLAVKIDQHRVHARLGDLQGVRTAAQRHVELEWAAAPWGQIPRDWLDPGGQWRLGFATQGAGDGRV
jgi:hypothetical protein